MLEDKKLMTQWNRGNPRALRRIYEKYKHSLVTLATALLFDKTAAEDVVHDLFARLLEKQEQLRIVTNLKSYLSCAVVNGARNINRKKNRNPSQSLDVVDTDLQSSQPQPKLFAEQKEANLKLTEALEVLPFEQREVILLRHYSGLKFKTIADIQETSINTAQGRYRYGMDKLRFLLNGELR